MLSKNALILIAGAFSSLTCAEETMPPEIDAARKGAYRVLLSLKHQMDAGERYDFAREQCASWKLSKADALTFLSQADEISGIELHHGYYSIACGYQGTFTADGQVYEFSINAGLHGVIKDVRSDKGYILGCKDKCRKLSPFDFYEAADDE